jgi:hypothetical protein
LLEIPPGGGLCMFNITRPRQTAILTDFSGKQRPAPRRGLRCKMRKERCKQVSIDSNPSSDPPKFRDPLALQPSSAQYVPARYLKLPFLSSLSSDTLALIPADKWHTQSSILAGLTERLTSHTAKWELDIVEFGMQYVCMILSYQSLLSALPSDVYDGLRILMPLMADAVRILKSSEGPVYLLRKWRSCLQSAIRETHSFQGERDRLNSNFVRSTQRLLGSRYIFWPVFDSRCVVAAVHCN